MSDIVGAASGGNRTTVPFTWFERIDASVGQRRDLPWPDLCAWIATSAPRAGIKDGLPLIKLATFRGDHRTNATVEAVHGIEGDYDAEVMQPADAAGLLNTAGITAFIYTSPSHRPDKPRWRVLCPLSRAVMPSERHGLVARVNGVLGGILAPESFTLSQAFYVGSVEGGEPVQCWNVAGRFIDIVKGLTPNGPPDHRTSQRKPLGSMPARSWDDGFRALYSIDPNELDRYQWIAHSAAFRQAMTGIAPDDVIRFTWDGWCAQYSNGKGNDPSDNAKQWETFNNGTDVGWEYLRGHASPVVRASLILGEVNRTNTSPGNTATTPAFGEYLSADEQSVWFAGCTLIGPDNRIIDAKGQEYDVGGFNSTFGGKKFIIDQNGGKTDEAWKAATRSTLWTIPKVDGTSFRTDLPTGNITTDELGRRSVNIYIPATIERMEGDASPFLNHLAVMIPNPDDQRILLDYMAHNAKYPGHKIPWAPVIQSTQGAGKNIIKYAMTHVIGDHYTYPPNPKELASGGGKFNEWMNRKLFLIADEIKTDDKRDMVEILKPMVSEKKLEMQKKGRDQRKADNRANWMFFTNWKDAIPIGKSDRRFAIFYSILQSIDDVLARGMNDAYFKTLYDDWLGYETHKTGLKIIANWLLNHPIARGAIPMRAPNTSSMPEAIIKSRGWLEIMITEAVEDQRNGFRAGWISTAAVKKMLRDQRKEAQAATIGLAIRALDYHQIGQSGRGYQQDDIENPLRRASLWNINPTANIANYGQDQGYE